MISGCFLAEVDGAIVERRRFSSSRVLRDAAIAAAISSSSRAYAMEQMVNNLERSPFFRTEWDPFQRYHLCEMQTLLELM